jgi:predicted Zn-dependent peptidase
MLSVHLGVAPDRGREALALVRRELEKLAAEGAPDDEVAAAKAQLRGSLVMSQEGVTSRMNHIAGEEIYHGHYTSPDEHAAMIERVTTADVAAAAKRFLTPGSYCLSALGPRPPGVAESDWAIAAREPVTPTPVSNGTPAPVAEPVAAPRSARQRRNG